MNQRKIAMFITDLGGGGAERVFVTLANHWAETHQGRIDFVLAQARGPYYNELSPLVNIVELNATSMPSSLFPLWKYLRANRPNVLLSTLDWANVVAVAANMLAGRATRVVLRQTSAMIPAMASSGFMRSSSKKALIRLLYPKAHDIIAISEGVAADLNSIIPRKDVSVIHNPIASSATQNRHEPSPLLSQKIDCKAPSNSVPLILAVGRLVKAKDYPTLIRAFAEVLKKTECKLLILGEGGLRKQIETLIMELGLRDHVTMPGFVPNPLDYMKVADVFVLSSAWEGFGNVLTEAMSVGTPVVATDCPGGPREILDEGRYGPLVEVGNVHQLAAAIIQSLESPTNSEVLIQRARDFSIEKIAGQYMSVLFPSG